MSTAAPQNVGTGNEPPGRPTVGELVARISDQFSRILRGEIELIQVKATEKAKKVGAGAAMFAVAALLGFFAFALLLTTAVLGLAEALPAWLSALIVAVVLLVIAAIVALVGKKLLQSGEAPSAEDTKANLKADIDAVKKGLSS
ncbi:phage holin family protein [Georgenia sp. H159]|uniref:phage holin family protein n=1 Tax=Georgenia sp. H159 TaxID=3076115 RepID=UPI002D77FF49|nr:phage holin family protein [Georgenia sp. H159]